MAVKPPDESVFEDSRRDPAAEIESKQFGNLARIESAKGDVVVAIHKTLSWLVPLGLIFAFFMFTAAGAVWLLQFILPHPWLSEQQHHELTTVLFSGALGAAVSRGAKLYFIKNGEE